MNPRPLYSLLLLLATVLVTVNRAQGACSQFGHSCFGAHGKRNGVDLASQHPLRLLFPYSLQPSANQREASNSQRNAFLNRNDVFNRQRDVNKSQREILKKPRDVSHSSEDNVDVSGLVGASSSRPPASNVLTNINEVTKPLRSVGEDENALPEESLTSDNNLVWTFNKRDSLLPYGRMQEELSGYPGHQFGGLPFAFVGAVGERSSAVGDGGSDGNEPSFVVTPDREDGLMHNLRNLLRHVEQQLLRDQQQQQQHDQNRYDYQQQQQRQQQRQQHQAADEQQQQQQQKQQQQQQTIVAGDGEQLDNSRDY